MNKYVDNNDTIVIERLMFQLKVISSISNVKSLLGGISPGNPFSPYAKAAGTNIFALSPIES